MTRMYPRNPQNPENRGSERRLAAGNGFGHGFEFWPIRVIFESSELLLECCCHFADRSVSLLADNNFCHTFGRNCLAFDHGTFESICFSAIDEHHDICILLNGAGFAKIAKQGTAVVAAFYTSI